MAVYKPKPVRPLASVVIWQGRPYYQNSVEELVKMTDCLCGVAYSPDCPVDKHRELQTVEAEELPGVEKLQMTEQQIADRRNAGLVMYMERSKLVKTYRERLNAWLEDQYRREEGDQPAIA